MKLHTLRIEGLRKHIDTVITFSDATFLIGGNNIGKSTVLKALECLLSDTKKLTSEEFCSVLDESTQENQPITDKVILTGEFRDLPEESRYWKGFKGRTFRYDNTDCPEESGIKMIYKKTYEPGQNYKVEMKQFKRELIDGASNCNTLNKFIEIGVPEQVIDESFPDLDKDKTFTKSSTIYKTLLELDELYTIDDSSEEWFENPGGIPGNVLSRLPKFLLIPAQDKIDELSGNSGALVKTLTSLFDDVRENSANFQQAQHFLGLLQRELNPDDNETEFGKMMDELNSILGVIFPRTKLLASANLSDPDKVIKPQFDIQMGSNVNTPIENQGTGVIRSAVFAMLRYRSMKESSISTRPLIIGFEEPEIYLHPNAIHQMRDTIYDLAGDEHNQIVCTTHSPFMIDLSRKSQQVLNTLNTLSTEFPLNGGTIEVEKIYALPFNITDAYKQLQTHDKTYIKMIVKLDDYISKVFFAKNVLIVEGDTEDIVLKESIVRLPDLVKEDILNNWQIIKARGKATIISLVKYLKAMGIHPYVMHDKDEGNEHAEKFNEPIKSAVDDDSRLFILENCMEDILGYNAPSSEKPYKAYQYINMHWDNDWAKVESSWKKIMEVIFRESFSLLEATDTTREHTIS